MLTTTLLSVLALSVGLAAQAEAGMLGSNLRTMRAHLPHRRLALTLHNKRGMPEKRCELKPSSTKVSHPTSTKTSTTHTATTSSGGGGGGGNGKTITGVSSSECPTVGATVDAKTGSGPNGAEAWLNCGVDTDGGWNPPPIQVSDLIYVDLADALNENGTPFTACEPYLDIFNQAASDFGVPPILLASIAMEESGCDAGNVGGAGEQGIMQITADKCPNQEAGTACRDPTYNIRTGAQYFATTLSGAGGNVAQALGEYNGWVKGLTVAGAEQAAKEGRPCQQNNLDYIHQQLNGWLQNISPYDAGLGTYQNMKACSG